MISRRFMPFALAAVLLAGTALSQTAAASPEIGKPAPDFQAVDSNGKTVKLSDLRGKLVVLEWTNHDCPYVKKHYGASNMQATQRDAAADGVVWLSVISSAPGTQGFVQPAEANELTAKRGATPANVLLDPTGAIGKAYGAQTTPHMYVIGKDGALLYKGGIDDKPTANPADIATAKNYVRTALEAVKAGRAVDPAVTRAYGCTVKYSS
jgi:peroxiredoxin